MMTRFSNQIVVMAAHSVNLLEITKLYTKMVNFMDCNYTSKNYSQKREKAIFSMILTPFLNWMPYEGRDKGSEMQPVWLLGSVL